MIFLLKKSSWLSLRYLRDINEVTSYKAYGMHKITKDWLKIVSRLEQGTESEYKLAVIEADNMLNDAYRRMGYPGESLGDKLKILNKDTCANVEDVREAHKIRNNIVHDPDYRLSLNEAQKVVAVYEQTFRDLEMI